MGVWFAISTANQVPNFFGIVTASWNIFPGIVVSGAGFQ